MNARGKGVFGAITDVMTQRKIRAALPARQAARLPVRVVVKPPKLMRRRNPAYWDDIRQRGFHLADIVIAIGCVISIAAQGVSFEAAMTWERFWQLFGPASAVLYMAFIGMITIADDAQALFAKFQKKLARKKEVRAGQ